MKNNKKKTLAIVFTVFALALVIGTTYAFVTRTLTGTKKVTLTAGTLSLVLDEKNEITISDALPMYDQVGMIQEEVFEFDLINNTSNPTEYTLKLQKVSTANELEISDVKYYLTKDEVGKPALLSTLTDGVIDTGTIEGNDTINYTLRLWISDAVTDQATITGKSLSYRLVVEASMVEEDASCPVLAETEPNQPQLTSGMIAVTYNEIDKTWVKADTTNNDWYDYKNQIWANAVTVTEDTRASYMAADVGEPILMDDINTMWVWIPRYSYTIMQSYGRTEQKCSELGEITFDSPSNCRKVEYPAELREEALNICKDWYSEVTTEEECIKADESYGFEEFIDYLIRSGEIEDTRIVVAINSNDIAYSTKEQPGAIDIRFIKTTEKDTSTGKYENCAENWVTPEGFTFGSEEIPGFWIGKFETSTLESCTIAKYSVNIACDLTSLTPQIKPNVRSWRGARVSTFFEASRLMQSADDTLTYNAGTYGFDTVGTSSMDSHMLKNTEWGIVAMLSQSKYGKYGNPNYIGADKEVAINNCDNYITGIGGDTVSARSSSTTCTTNTYETSKGQSASTTGTIYGVYDMSGGTSEYVMGNYNNISGFDSSQNSGFCGTNGPTENCRELPNEKYFDLYTTIESTGYKFGDGTYETKNWYSDTLFVADFYAPWFIRGFRYSSGTYAGVFASSSEYGGTNSDELIDEWIVYFASRFAIKP